MQTKNIYTSNNFNELTYSLVGQLKKLNQKPIILCIGSNKVIEDSLGPIVGHILITKFNIKTYVYGTLKRPVNAINIDFINNYIKKTHNEPKIIAVDASIGLFKQMGSITFKKGAIYPAIFAKKKLKPIGHLSFTAVTFGNAFRSKLLIKSYKAKIVLKMANIIATSINDAFNLTYVIK